jgi:hypothetical protein
VKPGVENASGDESSRSVRQKQFPSGREDASSFCFRQNLIFVQIVEGKLAAEPSRFPQQQSSAIPQVHFHFFAEPPTAILADGLTVEFEHVTV